VTLTWQPIGPAVHATQSSLGTPVHGVGEAFSSLNVSTYFLDLKATIDLGFGTIASYKNETNVTFYMLEVACYTGDVQATVKGPDSTEVLLHRMGVGFRIGVASFGTKNKATLTLAEVAANAQLNLTSTKVQVQILGADLPVINLLKPIQGMLTFKADSLQIIGKAGVDLAEYFKTNAGTLTPVAIQVAPLNVVANPDKFSYINTYSGQYAAERIWGDRSRQEALNQIANGKANYVVPSFVQAVYTDLGLREPDKKPDQTAKAKAGNILFPGRSS
jgi:hypothetical protein